MLTLAFGLGAFYFSGQQKEKITDQDANRVFLPGLMNKINDVAQIIISEKDRVTHLSLKNQRWIVEEKAGYQAEFSKIKTLLLGLAELKTIEAKTAKAENYGRLGVQAVGEPGEANSKQVQLLNKAGSQLYTIIVGKRKETRIPGGKPSVYVRESGKAKSWLVSGKIAIPSSQADWLNKKIININPSEIQSIKILQADDSQLVVSKQAKSDSHYSIENLPANAKLKSEGVADSLANTLQNLSFEDVLKRSAFQANEEQTVHISYKTFDGLVLHAKLLEKDGKHFLWFDVKTSSTDDAIVKKSNDLNANFALWVYEIPAYKAETLNKKLEDLIKAEEPNVSEPNPDKTDEK